MEFIGNYINRLFFIHVFSSFNGVVRISEIFSRISTSTISFCSKKRNFLLIPVFSQVEDQRFMLEAQHFTETLYIYAHMCFFAASGHGIPFSTILYRKLGFLYFPDCEPCRDR